MNQNRSETTDPAHSPNPGDWEGNRVQEPVKPWHEGGEAATPHTPAKDLHAAIGNQAAWDQFTADVPLVVRTGSPAAGDLPVSQGAPLHPRPRQ